MQLCERTCNKTNQQCNSVGFSARKAWKTTALAAALIVSTMLMCKPTLAQTTYGAGINSDALDNIPIGPNQTKVSYRFLANHTGKMSKLHLFLITDASKAGYDAGNKGDLLIQLQTDDGTTAHNPSGTTLASYTIYGPKNDWPILTFSSQPTLQDGRLYHLVFTNVGSNPGENYISLDELYMSPAVNPMQPKVTNENCAVLTHSEYGYWNVFQNDTPVFQIDFTDGTTQGQGYMEVWSNVPQPIGGTHAVRQAFTVSGGEHVVSKFSVRVARTGGSAPLTVRLENANGQLIEQGTIPAAEIPASSSSSPKYVWATYTFSALRPLFAGDSYHIDLEASTGTTYETFPIRKGSKESFSGATYFPDGYAQFKNGSTWVGWTEWGQTNRTDGDLQFYFTIVP